MKRRILSFFGMTVMVLAVAFSLIQLRMPVVRAEGCPPGQAVGCGCMFMGGVSVQFADRIEWQCNYLCGGCGGGGNEMQIETMVQVTEWL